MLLYVQCCVLSITAHFLPVGVELADMETELWKNKCLFQDCNAGTKAGWWRTEWAAGRGGAVRDESRLRWTGEGGAGWAGPSVPRSLPPTQAKDVLGSSVDGGWLGALGLHAVS